jgi:hypothetical protein
MRGVGGPLSVPHGALVANAGLPTPLNGAYVYNKTATSVDFRWKEGGFFSGSSSVTVWIASTVYGLSFTTGKYAYTSSPTFSAGEYSGLTVTGLTTATPYTFYLWVSNDFGDGFPAIVNVTTS